MTKLHYNQVVPSERCALCNNEVNEKTGQSCSCNQAFCYPLCFKQHQKSTGDRT